MGFLIFGIPANLVEDDAKREIIVKEPNITKRVGDGVVNLVQVQYGRRCLDR